jgi:hypothetical protein
MNKTTTQIDLMNYAYNQTGLIKSDLIQRSIDGDPVVKDEFNEIVTVMNLLDNAKPEINPSSLEKILQFC